MSVALVYDEQHCPACRRLKPSEEFRSHRYCAECKNAYARGRNQAIKDGTWKPTPAGQRAEPRPFMPMQPAKPVPERRYGPRRVQLPVGADVQLRAALVAFLLAYGFSALRQALDQMQGDICKEHRDLVAREGWIA